MAVSKVVYNGSTLIDLTSDTVTAATLLSGYTAHNKAGTKITGTYAAPNLSGSTAAVGDVIEGKTFYSGNTTLKTGTLPVNTNQNVNATGIHLSTNYVNFYIPRGAYTFNGNIYVYQSNADVASAIGLTPGVLASGATVLGISGSAWMPVAVLSAIAVTCGQAEYEHVGGTIINSAFGTLSGTGTATATFTVSKAGVYRISGSQKSGATFDDGETRNNKGSTSTSATSYGAGNVSLAVGSKITVKATATPSSYDCVNGGSASVRAVLISYVGQ